MEKINFHDVTSPFGDTFYVALLEPKEAKVLYKEIGGKNVTTEFGLSKLRDTYQLTNGWILYNQNVAGEWLIYFDETVFRQILEFGFDPGMGIRFSSMGNEKGNLLKWPLPDQIRNLVGESRTL